MNSAVAKSIPRDRWARIAAEDFRSANPSRFGQQAVRLRRFRGFAREHYGALGLSDEELSAALEALGANRPGR